MWKWKRKGWVGWWLQWGGGGVFPCTQSANQFAFWRLFPWAFLTQPEKLLTHSDIIMNYSILVWLLVVKINKFNDQGVHNNIISVFDTARKIAHSQNIIMNYVTIISQWGVHNNNKMLEHTIAMMTRSRRQVITIRNNNHCCSLIVLTISKNSLKKRSKLVQNLALVVIGHALVLYPPSFNSRSCKSVEKISTRGV